MRIERKGRHPNQPWAVRQDLSDHRQVEIDRPLVKSMQNRCRRRKNRKKG